MRAVRRHRTGKLLVILAAAALLPVFVVGLALVGYLMFPPAPLDILILGLDARPDEGYATRTDSILLLNIDPAHLRLSLLSIPRDLFIETPGYGLQRINAINVLGEQEGPGRGASLLAEAVGQNFDVEVDRTIRLNFETFVELVDAVGGVTVSVERVISDDFYPTPDGGVMQVRFEPGVQTLDGERALIYARTRHADDDYRRADRQQQVLVALSTKLRNPAYWPAVIGVLTRQTDTTLTLGDVAAMAPVVFLNAGRIDRRVIDRDTITATAGGQATPDFAALAAWIEPRFD